MTGLDKIISQILEDAGKEAQEISEKAKSEAEAVLAEAKAGCKKIAAENDEKWPERPQAIWNASNPPQSLKNARPYFLQSSR